MTESEQFDAEATLPIEALDRINGICLQFEVPLKKGEQPRIEDYLAKVTTETERSRLFHELLLLELDYAGRAGAIVSLEDYNSRFPDRTDSIAGVFAFVNAPVQTTEQSPTGEKAGDPLPDRIGAYKILETLGEGGMGVVYLAEQNEPIRRRVALKVIKLGMDTREVIARFEAERQALAMMNHPNIAKVFDAGSTEQGRPYFVMEHVAGVPITEHCDRQRLSMIERLELFMLVCDAVQHAHQKAIIHRDIKPSNILVAILNRESAPKIIDFGVAKATNQRLTEATVFTEIGQIIGTPAYMSPEQAEMTAQDIDTRSDIYSLGVLLYELLVGTRPFDATKLRQAGWAEIQRVVREETPPTPSIRLRSLGKESLFVAERRRTELRTLLRQLRGDLDWITAKAMEKDRTRRYATASEFAEDIARHLRNEPVVASPPSLSYRLRKVLRRHRVPLAAAAALALVVVIGFATSLSMYFRAEEARFRISQAFTRSESLRLTAESSMALPSNPGLALLLAIEGAKRHRSLVSNNALLAALDTLHEQRLLMTDTQGMKSVTFSPDGKRVLTLWGSGTGQIWDVDTGHKLFTLTTDGKSGRWWNPKAGEKVPKPQIPLFNAAKCTRFSPDGKRVVTATPDGVARVWNAESGRKLFTLEGHEGSLNSASFSPESKRVVTASNDATARIWCAEIGESLFTLEGHSGPVESARFSPDGNWIVTGSRDNTACIWNANTGESAFTLTGHERYVKFATFNSESKRVVTASEDDTVRVWSAESGEELSSWRTERIYSTSLSPDDSRFVTGSWGGTARLWDLETGTELFTWRGHGNVVTAAHFSPDGKRVLTAANDSQDPTIRIWDAETGIELTALKGHEKGVLSAAFSPNGKRVVSLSGDSLRVWNVRSGKELSTIVHGRNVSASFSPDGKSVAIAAGDNTSVRVWDAKTRRDLLTLTGHAKAFSIKFSPDGTRLATTTEGGDVCVWDAETGEQTVVLGGHRGRATCEFSPDCRYMVTTASYEGKARIWDTDTGEQIRTLAKDDADPGAWLKSASFSHDGTRVLTSSLSHGVRIWDTRDGKEFPVLYGRPVFADFSQDGNLVVGATPGDRTVCIWNASTGEKTVTLGGSTKTGVNSVAFSPDGKRIVTASRSNFRIWDAQTGQELSRGEIVADHTTAVPVPASFSPDGKWVLTAHGDTARIWDAETGQELMTLKHSSGVRSAAFSPQGESVLTTTNNTVRLWPLDPLSIAEERKPRELTPDEMDRYEIGTPEERAELRRRWRVGSNE